MDERGYCRIEGRLKEMIIRGGENICPREIKQLLYAHPGVADAAVVGVPGDDWGEQVAAFVRPAPGTCVIQDELPSWCRAAWPPARHHGTGSLWTPSPSAAGRRLGHRGQSGD